MHKTFPVYTRESGFSQMPLLVTVTLIFTVLLAGMGFYTWQLSREVAALKSPAEDSAVAALSRQTEPDVLFGADPGAPSLFGSTHPAQDPFAQMEAFRQQMDTMMNSFFGGSFPSVTGPSVTGPSATGIPGVGSAPGSSLFGQDPFAAMGLNQPNLSLRETDSALEVVIPVQDGQQFELSTDVEQDRLTVAGTLSWSSQDSSNGMVSSRRSSSQFSRTIMLPDNVDPAGLTTEHRGHEIVITLPKA